MVACKRECKHVFAPFRLLDQPAVVQLLVSRLSLGRADN